MSSALTHGLQANAIPLKEMMLRTLRTVWAGPLFRWRFSGFHPQEILFSPVDLHLADASIAHEFYHGRFPLAGRVVHTGTYSPFAVEAPTAQWETALHNFSWLKHMDAAQTAIAFAHARSLLSAWIDSTNYKTGGIPWRGEVVGKRITAWICHAPMLLGGASDSFRKRFLRSLGFQVRFLRTAIARMENNENRLTADIALAFAALTLPMSEKRKIITRKNLEVSLAKQILPDGGHISRNPAVILDLLTELISLRHAYSGGNETPPHGVITAIERMLPALRFFMHRDATLARFNGVGPILPERLTTVLQLDETDGGLFTYAPHSGYQRLAKGETTIIADTGAIPPRAASAHADAGCLAFEMSSGTHRFIINCGIDPFGPKDYTMVGRSTAAHSTATINDTSSCRFKTKHDQTRIISGPDKVKIEPINAEGRCGFIASHNGYAARFGLMHERGLALSAKGDIIDGYDHFFTPGEEKLSANARDQVAIRFHLHPDVEVSHQGSGELYLEIKGGDIWTFSSPDIPPQLEDSIDLANLNGPQRCRQIVLHLRPSLKARARWRLKRISAA